MWLERLLRIKDESSPFSKKKNLIPKTTIATIWIETKQKEGGRKNLLGALRKKDDLRLGVENALKIYARQSENLKN